jgi:hypothetical protein
MIIFMVDDSYKNEKYTQKLGFTYEIPNVSTTNCCFRTDHRVFRGIPGLLCI